VGKNNSGKQRQPAEKDCPRERRLYRTVPRNIFVAILSTPETTKLSFSFPVPMSNTNRFKQNIILFSSLFSFVVFFVATVAVVVLFWHEEVQDNSSASQPVPPLIVEPNRLDFQGIGKGTEEKHEGIVHLVNQSDRTIALLFTESSCTCSVAELPGSTILPGEKLPMKCTLSTVGRISNRAGGEIWIAYRFADADEENLSPQYVRVILTAVVDSDPQGELNQ
jgi:hypothetical protein